ncbi:MAG: hypothetical protein EP330_27300 [Deltaproteobacteria bacterium]|nr:MAG: hypothetical protein EP330_27300 [Deltaproteobacteria bacterium]
MIALLALLLSPAHAEDCDAKALAKELADASPAAIGKQFTALAACDEGAAKKAMDEAFGKMIENDGAHAAVVAGLKLGGEEPSRAFLANLDPSESAQTLGYLADHCDEPGVTEFFVSTRGVNPDAFWDGGWYRALATCRSEGSLALLSESMKDPAVQERLVRTQWMSLIETYARAAGPAAMNSLRELTASLDSEADLVDVIGFFADAARVGDPEADPKDAAAAVAAIKDVGPKLPPLAVEKARDTLVALGDEPAADEAVRWRWPERLESNGYSYAAVAVEDITCKNGKKRVHIHTAPVTGVAWPDQLEGLLSTTLQLNWELDPSKTCKGTGEVRYGFPDEPFADAVSRDAWIRSTAETLRGSVDATTKVVTAEYDALPL